MRIGSVSVPGRAVLAPMAGVTDPGFRYVCKKLGADYTYTEMVSAKALCYRDEKTRSLLASPPDAHPFAAQIFGSDPVCMQEAAALAAEESGADVIDINMGCPVGKIAGSGDGSALMRTPEKAAAIVEAVCRAAGRPVSVKIRRGWDSGSCNAPEFALAMQQAGAAAIAVHGRTKTQMYSGRSDWQCIRAVKEAVTVPVIANGDVFSARDAERLLRLTGADAVMVGRGAFGDPWLFSRIRAALAGEEEPALPPLPERLQTALEQFTVASRYRGERVACLEARRHLAWYLRGFSGASRWREQVCSVTSLEDIRALIGHLTAQLRLEKGERP